MSRLDDAFKRMESKAERLRMAAFEVKPQPDAACGLRCVSFHRRMLASLLDTAVISFTILPLSFWLTNVMVGQLNMDVAPFVQTIGVSDDPAVRERLIHQFLVEEGRLHYFYTNTLLQLVGLFAYCIICWSRWGMTPGKWVARCQVVHEKTGQRLSVMQSFWRCVGYIFACLPLCLGVVWASFDKKRQGWHDKFVGSAVVELKPRVAATSGEPVEDQPER